MENDYKIQRKKLIEKTQEKDPQFKDARKFILAMCRTFLITRLMFVVIETTLTMSAGLELSSCMINWFSLLVGLAFMFLIYNGSKPLVYLATMGGFISLIQFVAQIYIIQFAIETANTSLIFYYIAFAITVLAQIITMISILIKKACKGYFTTISEINNKLLLQNQKKL